MAGKDDLGLDQRLPWGRGSTPEPDPSPRSKRTPSDRPPPATSAEAVNSPSASPPRPAPDALDLSDPRAAAIATRIDGRLERLELGLTARLDRIEEQADSHIAGLEVRLEKLEAQLEVSRDASLEAVGILAGRLVAMLEEQVGGIDFAVRVRHEDLTAQLAAATAERHDELARAIDGIHDATRGLASSDMVERLLEGVVALGEVLDADLVNLRRLITADIGPPAGAKLRDFGDHEDLDEPEPGTSGSS